MKSVAEALEAVAPHFAPLGSEHVMLEQALDRHLARAVAARSDSPPFDNSAMDGYAVRAADLAGASEATPRSLPVQGESRAGGPPPPPLSEGTAMRIFTGAPMPAGADAVVIQEDVRRDGELAVIPLAPRPGAHVRAAGSDLAQGAEALPAGARLGSGELALLASQDVASVEVCRQPRVAILSTGDELREIGTPPRPGSIVNSNAYALAAQVREAGAVAWRLPPSPDRLDVARERIEAALTADVVVVSGGVSVGEYDVVRDALEAAGVELRFWKIRMKPGKPVAFGLGKQGARAVPVVGLPGNPVSTWVTFELFVRPGLRRMLGDPRPYRRALPVRVAQARSRKPGRVEFARARLEARASGTFAHLHPRQGSGALPSLAGVDALAVLPADCANLAEGDTVLALLLGGPGSPTPDGLVD